VIDFGFLDDKPFVDSRMRALDAGTRYGLALGRDAAPQIRISQVVGKRVSRARAWLAASAVGRANRAVI